MARTILAVANQTIGGQSLIDAVLEKAGGEGGARVIICVPRTNPTHGNIIYDDAVYDAAQIRIDLARGFLRQRGIDSVGDVGDPDPYTATMDAVAEWRPDEIIVSTLPAQASGWLRRDLVERIQEATGVPVTHVTTDLDEEGLPFKVTLVAANRTTRGDELIDTLKSMAHDEQHLFIVVVPPEGGGGQAVAEARGRLSQLRERARHAGLVVAGMVGDPDPYTAIMNALQFFRVDDILISTLPETRSGWMRARLVERVQRGTTVPVEHIVAGASETAGNA
ncbi:MAG: hypothetical protein QOK49_57 [Baekduia sp.]|nr:hypothetical protein [Baekduia sp.]